MAGGAKARPASGHARLKKALVMRDALAAELGLPRKQVMNALKDVETEHGARKALDEQRYLHALEVWRQGDAERLSRLDERVADAATAAGFAPRYPQYLALLFFAAWLDLREEDEAAFIARLNDHLRRHPPRDPAVPDFRPDDLQTVAFWMATGAGKTHLLHAVLVLLETHRSWGRVLVVTPSEALTRQHAAALNAVRRWPVFAYPDDGDLAALGRVGPDTVIVIDINKLTETKRGDGVSVPVSLFQDGRNLVFVDEGHKGQGAAGQAWKRVQRGLAGIGEEADSRRGLLVEFSATFGQAAQAEHAFDTYAKSIVFDYPYDRFHADLYGKDFESFGLKGAADDPAARDLVLTAALLAFWHQLATYRSEAAKRAAAGEGVQVAEPLWVLLGLSVIGKSGNEDERAQTSDVVGVLKFLAELVADPAVMRDRAGAVMDAARTAARILPPEARTAVQGLDLSDRAAAVLGAVFGWRPGDRLVFRLIRRAAGEMGIGILRGDRTGYVGVVNVGDPAGLRRAMETAGLAVEEDALSDSLFARLDRPGSGLSILIGSRRFAEGWDNYRASSLTLLRLGQGEGSLIVQMFGRVVRFAGRLGDGKRLADPPLLLAPLQTAYIYGLRSAYLEAFLAGLKDNGLPAAAPSRCPVILTVPEPCPLQAVAARTPEPRDFTADLTGKGWLGSLASVVHSLAAGLSTARMAGDDVRIAQTSMAVDLTGRFRDCLPLIDVDAVYRGLVDWRQRAGLWNLRFDRAAVDAALSNGNYELHGLPDSLRLKTGDDLRRLHRIATALVRRQFEGMYRRAEGRSARYALIALEDSGIPERYRKGVIHEE